VDAFRPANEFKSHMDNWINRFRAAKPVDGVDRVLIPGDPEREMAAERIKTGIPVNGKVVEDLKELATRFSLSFG
ncbi:MAG TPA: Ldh family oxidoreductase, partial [Chryseosolibacter sp.]